MQKIQYERLIRQLALVNTGFLALSYGLVFLLGSPEFARALSWSYVVAGLNVMALTYLGGLIIRASLNPNANSAWLKALMLGLGFGKVVLVVGAFFVMTSVLRLDPVAIFCGALLALTVNVSALCRVFVKSLRHEAIQRNSAPQRQVHSRLSQSLPS